MVSVNEEPPCVQPLVASTARRVTMGDVDAVQVYAPNYFRWMGQGEHELLAKLGHPLRTILAEGFAIPVVKATCDYIAPANLEEVVTCITSVSRVGSTSFDLTHVFNVGGRDVAVGALTHVWIKRGNPQRPMPVPEWLRVAVTGPDTDREPRDS